MNNLVIYKPDLIKDAIQFESVQNYWKNKYNKLYLIVEQLKDGNGSIDYDNINSYDSHAYRSAIINYIDSEIMVMLCFFFGVILFGIL